MQLDNEFTLKGKKYNWELHLSRDTGETDDKGNPVIYTDKWYFPKLSMVLDKYVEEATRPLESVKELREKLDEILTKIESL